MRLLTLLLCTVLLAACSKAPQETRKIKMYQSPMHPWITSDKPGNCTICGMQLVPVYEGEEAMNGDKSLISLHDSSVAALSVATVPVQREMMTKNLRFTGILEDDENIHRVIAAFYDGRIDRVYVHHVGEYIEKGQPLAAIYSPELLYIVREYQTAMRGGDQAVARNSAQRLVQYGLSPEQLAGLAKTPDAVYTIDLLAPISGTVVTKKAYLGQFIKTGEPLFEMGDLSKLWFHAEVYERDLPDIRIGEKAIIRTPTVPGREFPGVVTFIDPNFDAATRSTKVRIEVENPLADGDQQGLRRMLPHRAYAEADLIADLGERLVVPRSAVLRDGRREVVYLEEGPGKYIQRSVKTGRVAGDRVEILAGVNAGDKVVSNGNLMIDAEAQLRGGETPAIQKPEPALQAAPAEVMAFLQGLAKVSDALAADNPVQAVAAGEALPSLAKALPHEHAMMSEIEAVQEVSLAPSGSTLAEVRKAFLPWSQAGSALALAVAKAGMDPGVQVLECPMTGGSFPGAPSKARWVQAGADTRNPYLGAAMLNCGVPAKP